MHVSRRLQHTEHNPKGEKVSLSVFVYYLCEAQENETIIIFRIPFQFENICGSKTYKMVSFSLDTRRKKLRNTSTPSTLQSTGDEGGMERQKKSGGDFKDKKKLDFLKEFIDQTYHSLVNSQ